ncbi:hypothetical protein C6P46_005563 [Rhodotorula mucilaginosa]|uniref:D-arabinitol 2-dehydrogenase n=1 Tax=Rhodotorula mucilaginosa TaxID=5537 RepID=A0A9P7B523_RHOMI|nr:hypothetical protein C6P46_005563 [Rhodotorula mucilaginosa]TKA56628.1 hypothetical protein B0A53_01820 [Rhodotorula sp. CCFEE 5036]
MFARSATLKALPRAGRSFATQAVRFAPRVAAAAAPTSSPLSRRKVSSSSTAAADNKEAPFAAVREDIQIPYPDETEYKPGELGHSTDGPDVDVGRHTRRTLASFSMTDKVCVVTGAGRGLGNLMARTFAESGSNAIAILDLDENLAKEAANDLVQWFEEHGQAKKGEIKCIGIGCDVANEESVKASFKQVVDTFGRVDSLVTAAGIVENFVATEYPGDRFRKLMAINVEGSFYCAREAAKDMMRRDAAGTIVLIGSMSGACVNIPQPQTPYNASKAAVRHMASSLAVEWAQKNIRVNCISPGYMATALTRVILDRDPELRDAWVNLTPMARLGEPEDLKGACIYLASDASAFTTGADIRVDGGYTLT